MFSSTFELIFIQSSRRILRQGFETSNATRWKDAQVLICEQNLRLRRWSNRGVLGHLSIWGVPVCFPEKRSKVLQQIVLIEGRIETSRKENK